MLVIRQAEAPTLRFDADCDVCGVGIALPVTLAPGDVRDMTGDRVEIIVRRVARELVAVARERGCQCPTAKVRTVGR